MDHVDATKRSEMMRSVGQKNTKPEVTLRSALHARGLRYRLHRKDLKGRPDIVFPKYGTCMFVHGCFWHRHGCSRSTTPKSNSSFWHDKFRANVARDRRAVDELLGAGWRVLTVWECGILGKGRAEEAAAFIQEWLKTDQLEGEYPFPQASDQSHAM